MLKKQRGVALVTGMVLMLVATVIGISSTSETLLQERAAGNQRAIANAFMAAEDGLISARIQLAQNGLSHTVTLTSGVFGVERTVAVGQCNPTNANCRLIRVQATDSATGALRVLLAEYWRGGAPAEASTIVMLGNVDTFKAATSNAFTVQGETNTSGTVVGSAIQVNEISALQKVLDGVISVKNVENYVGGFEYRDCDIDALNTLLADQKYLAVKDKVVCTPPPATGDISSILSDAKKLEDFIKEIKASYSAADATKKGTVPSDMGTVASPKITVWTKPVGCTGAACTLTFQGNLRGAGVLLVEGNLEFSGTPEFSGIIIVTGQSFKVTGGGKGGVGGSNETAGFGGTIIFTNPVKITDAQGVEQWEFREATAELDFEITGGGKATFKHDAQAISEALKLLNKKAENLWITGDASGELLKEGLRKWKECAGAADCIVP